MYRSAVYDEPLLNELASSKKEKIKPLGILPDSLKRNEKINIPDIDETQVVRHFHHLSQMNYGIDSGIYPLG
jgi:glycine dehydrogenase subunit 2